MPRSDQGVSSNRYTLIPRTLIFISRGTEILLLKGAPHKRLWANQYNGVGGHVERGEDVLSAARRELGEETGLDIPDLWLCGTVTVDVGDEIGIGIYIFRGSCTQCDPTFSSEGTLEWIPIMQIHNIDLVEDLHTLLPQVLKMEPGKAPFSAHYCYDEEDQLRITILE